MKAVVAVVMGFFSGFLFYLMMSMILLRPSAQGAPLAVFVLITFFGGWGLSSYVLQKDARTVSKVFSRGFLLGAAEWLCIMLVGVVSVGKNISSQGSFSGSSAASAGTVIGGGIAIFVTGAVSLFMAIVCLTGFAISYFIGREMAPQAAIPSKKCPQCAELVQAEAVRCRYCGAELSIYLNAPQKGFSQ